MIDRQVFSCSLEQIHFLAVGAIPTELICVEIEQTCEELACNFGTVLPSIAILYPMVWCGAILPPIHRHRYTQYDNTFTRV